MKKISLLGVAGLFIAFTAQATLLREQFTNNPALDGWQIFGDTNLFEWDSTNHVLDVTWDSTQPNSYYYVPLGRTYTMADGFYVQFDLQLSNAVSFNSGSELAIGLLNFSDATNSGFSRAYGYSPNLCEFDYFPTYVYESQQYPASDDVTLIDASTNFYFGYDNLALNPGVTYRVEFIHQPGSGFVSGQILTNGQLYSSMPYSYGGPDGDFQLDTLAVMNYADDGFGDSIYAQGTVGDIAFASPLPIGLIQSPVPGQVQFGSDTNWLYLLKQSPDFQTWTPAAPPAFGNGTNLVLQATNLPATNCFYRVKARLP